MVSRSPQRSASTLTAVPLLFASVADPVAVLMVRGRSDGAGEGVEAGDIAHRNRDAIAAQATVPQDLPGLHSSGRALDADPHLPV